MPRQKAVPKQSVRGLGAQKPATTEDVSEDEYDVNLPPPKRRSYEDEDDDVGAAAKNKKKKTSASSSSEAAAVADVEDSKPKAAAGGGGGATTAKAKTAAPVKTYFDDIANTGEGGGGASTDFDPVEAATNYINAEAASQPTMLTMGYHQHQQNMSTARQEAANKAGPAVEIHVIKQGEAGSSSSRRNMKVTFTYNRKQYQDKCPIYTRDELVQIFTAVLRRLGTKRRKATASHPYVKLDQVALRSPPLFWNLFHIPEAYNDAIKGLKLVMEEAEEAMKEE